MQDSGLWFFVLGIYGTNEIITVISLFFTKTPEFIYGTTVYKFSWKIAIS